MLGRKIFTSAVGLIGLATMSGCDIDELKNALEDGVGTCLEPCAKIQECEATANPPAPVLPGGMGGELPIPDEPVVACATNCAGPDRVFNGYSDCQLECISSASCGNLNACWDVTSDRYADFCIPAGEEPPPAVPEEGSGSDAFDDAVDNPAVEEAVAESGTELFTGGAAPDMIGLWTPVTGTIDESSNARDPGSLINTSLCFWDADTTDGALNYCEVGVYGPDGSVMTSTAPISGDGGDGWTTIIEFEHDGAIVASIIFSGLRTGGTAPEMEDVDALVTYYQGMNIWEHSFTNWTLGGACDISSCE